MTDLGSAFETSVRDVLDGYGAVTAGTGAGASGGAGCGSVPFGFGFGLDSMKRDGGEEDCLAKKPGNASEFEKSAHVVAQVLILCCARPAHQRHEKV